MKNNKWKGRNTIKALKDELANNKKVFPKNEELLKMKLELEKANLEDFEMEEKRYKITRDMLDIELKNFGILQPMMNFHNLDSWVKKFHEFKKYEKENNERNFKTAQKNFENQISRISQMINEEKIKEQQTKIETRNQEIIAQLRELGENVDENIPKQDYIN